MINGVKIPMNIIHHKQQYFVWFTTITIDGVEITIDEKASIAG
jgi:hypothetical protein